MRPTDDDTRPMTEADRTSETRFGPRPVPPGHRPPHQPLPARRTVPTGRVSPDGRSAYPAPSTTAKLVVWGGVALGVAGGTAAALFAVRKIAAAIADDPQPERHGPRPSSAPRFAVMDEDDREAMRRRVRAQDREDRQQAASLRAEASKQRQPARPKKRKGNFAEDLIQTSTNLSQSLEGVVRSITVAMEGFRGVAGQANGIMSDFAATADQLRSALRGDQPAKPRRDADDSDRNHRL